jgi:hypothetical protein
MIREINFSISNMNLTGISGWPTHESQETDYRKAGSGWVKLPLEKRMKDYQTHVALH